MLGLKFASPSRCGIFHFPILSYTTLGSIVHSIVPNIFLFSRLLYYGLINLKTDEFQTCRPDSATIRNRIQYNTQASAELYGVRSNVVAAWVSRARQMLKKERTLSAG